MSITYYIMSVNGFSMYGYAGDGDDIPARDCINVKPYISQEDLDEQFVSEVNSVDISFNVIANTDVIVNNENLRIQINDENDLDIEENELYNKDAFRFLTYRTGESAPLFCFENDSSHSVDIWPASVVLDG